MDSEPSRRDPPPLLPKDSVIRGVLLTVGLQILFIAGIPLLTLRLMSAVSYRGSAVGMAVTLFRWWGVAQWAALIPLCFWQRRRGHPLTVNGILITGCIGFLLNAGCAALLFPHY